MLSFAHPLTIMSPPVQFKDNWTTISYNVPKMKLTDTIKVSTSRERFCEFFELYTSFEAVSLVTFHLS